MRILVLALLVIAPFAAGEEERKPTHHVLVELFTSQG
jgi:hypothetical protein